MFSFKRLYCVVVYFLLLAVISAETNHQQEEEEHDDNNNDNTCGLYMAESSIPNSGWGMYTAKHISKNAPIYPLDVVIQVADYARHQKYRSHYLYQAEKLPLWLMEEYYWNSQITWAWHDAKKIQSIVPGLGMLANSHPGLVNAKEQVPQWKPSVTRNSVESGAYSQYKNMTFVASQDIPVGHELMVEYGDHWFKAREYAFGQDIPLSRDYQQADEIVENAAKECNDTTTLESDECQALWNATRTKYAENTTTFSSRVYSALPELLTLSVVENGTARHSVPNVVRSMEWLQENGKCLDNLEVRDNSTIAQAGSGAFATRSLPKGSIVAPAPVVHLHRGHLELYFPDLDDDEQFHWKGLQLLQNYMYGHPSTSLLFFPYSPAVNLINHSPRPNVKLQWSDSVNNKDWFHRSTDDLIANENDHAGLLMELVALRDIEPGEEVFLDYGRDWQEAWEHHVSSWRKPLDSKTHGPVEPYKHETKLPTRQDYGNEDIEPLPLNAMTVCWVDWEDVEETDDPTVFVWTSDHITEDQTESRQCTLLSRLERNGKYRYTAEMKIDGKKYTFTDILRRGIDVVDRPYTANQFLRQSFRHFIQMPDDMIPEAWKDLEHPVEDEQCGLYMAESSIPNSGLGMYTGKLIKDLHPIAFPEIAIQCPDVDENSKLWHWRVKKEYDENKPAWLLENYYWNPPYTGAEMEATEIQSIVPGIGMLANSHTGAFNALSRLPVRDNTGLRPQTDPGAGASSSYHGMNYMAHNGDLPAGSELFVEYGDHWFLDQEERLGIIPLSEDFAEADELLVKVWETIGGDPTTDGAQQKWDEFLSELSEDEDEIRVFMALPKNLSDVEYVLDYGTALFSARDSIKPIEWLEQNGRCLDNIKPAVSSIPQAGYGAFATRSIKKGNVITTTPLVQLHRDQMAKMESNDVNNPKSEILFNNDQLLLNYCFGHDNSDFLLYPYSPVVNYINHDQEKYNAELRWSDLSYHQSDWLERPVHELVDLDHTGLIMEFVATRDIRPGEEILINYGTRWQQAWDKYVETWEPNPYYKRYTPAWEFNDYTLPVRTIEEQKVRPYPDEVFIGCYVSSSVEQQPGAIVDGKLQYQWVYEPSLYHTTLDMTKCEIVERYKEYVETADSIRPVGELYKVRVWRHHQMTWTVVDVPRRAIEFFDHKYFSDLHLRDAFRHEMDLPDHMFPEMWMHTIVDTEEVDAIENENIPVTGDEL